MPITAWVILLLVLPIVPILLIRYCKKVGGCLQLSCYEPDHQPICRPIARLRHSYSRWSKVRHGLPDASECFSSAGRIPDCAHLRSRKRMGQERDSRWRMQV